ncbi:MAG: hypothetical protein AB1540_04400 [Bdellovibrionota bacterium]
MSSNSAWPFHILVAVGSRHDRVCSIGAFARAEANAYQGLFSSLSVLEPDESDHYPVTRGVSPPDAIFFHAPALHDRIRPWNAILSALKLRLKFPRAKFISIVHEYSEAPTHWRLRQGAILKISHGAIANTKTDYEGALSWTPNVLRSRLGPTLFYKDLVECEDAVLCTKKLIEKRLGVRAQMSQELNLPAQSKWLLQPGLLTPGKGVDRLHAMIPYMPQESVLIVMGGFGPKLRDREFAERVLGQLKSHLGSRIAFIDSPSDEIYKSMVLSADLVALPYEAGVSERRSSFLSAASCGANIWTTTGQYSEAFQIARSGAHQVLAKSWIAGEPKALSSMSQALSENDEASLQRRLKNLSWARMHSWKTRAKDIALFLEMLRQRAGAFERI